MLLGWIGSINNYPYCHRALEKISKEVYMNELQSIFSYFKINCFVFQTTKGAMLGNKSNW